MTRPTDASLARAFYQIAADIDPLDSMPNDDLTFVAKVTALAAQFDAESPAGKEVAMVQNDDFVASDGWKIEGPGHGATVLRINGYDICPKCTAAIPAGKHCGGPNCPLRK